MTSTSQVLCLATDPSTPMAHLQPSLPIQLPQLIGFGPLCLRGGGAGLAGSVEAAGARCGLRGGKAGARLCGPGEDREGRLVGSRGPGRGRDGHLAGAPVRCLRVA